MKSTFAIVKRLLASNKISFIIKGHIKSIYRIKIFRHLKLFL